MGYVNSAYVNLNNYFNIGTFAPSYSASANGFCGWRGGSYLPYSSSYSSYSSSYSSYSSSNSPYYSSYLPSLNFDLSPQTFSYSSPYTSYSSARKSYSGGLDFSLNSYSSSYSPYSFGGLTGSSYVGNRYGLSFSYSQPSFNWCNSYSFAQNYRSTNTGGYQALGNSGIREKYSIPTKTGKYKTPSFKSSEARRLWTPFITKAAAFDPKRDLGPEFLAKVKQISLEIDCDYKDLLAVMHMESKLNPYIPNLAGYCAYGLVQFQPDTLRGMGYQPEDLLKMTPVQQLDVVKKHYLKEKASRGLTGKHLSTADVYGLVLAPAYMQRKVIYAGGTNGYNANKNLDLKFGNANGYIDRYDLEACAKANRVSESIFA